MPLTWLKVSASVVFENASEVSQQQMQPVQLHLPKQKMVAYPAFPHLQLM
jgi:hypothetical protein